MSEEVSLDSQKCIMVVGAHAHDPEVMGGAAVLKHVDMGWRAVIVHMTLGEKGHRTLSADEYTKIKTEEAYEAARRLAAECVILPYQDGELPVSEEAQWYIADAIRKYRPNILLTHWKGSFHKDHRNTYTNTMESLFYAGLKTFQREHRAFSPERVLFSENWEDIDGFVPDLYLDVTDVWDRFIHAMRAYSLFRGEVSTFAYEQWYQGASVMRGAEAGFGRAVAMMKPESVYGRRRPVRSLEE